MNSKNELVSEARAFDGRLAARIAAGFMPDLRRVQACDWFYNNPWRRAYLAAMDFGRAFEFARSHAKGRRLLEVGCGPGHMSLEFARHGFDVVGLDLSPYSIEIARRFQAENPFTQGFGSVEYVQADLLSWGTGESRFDTVCFFGTLHHFAQPCAALEQVSRLLEPGARVVVAEPARDWISRKNAAVVALIRILLDCQGRWYERQPLPGSEGELTHLIERCFVELTEGRDFTEPTQSPKDNSSAAVDMLTSLNALFVEIECRKLNGFMQRVVGGIRSDDEDDARRIAEFIDLFDRVSIPLGLVDPGEFYWVGYKR